jgi:zinc and cadmium transporter
MTLFLWILISGLAMSAIALVGSATLLMREETLKRLLLPLVAFAAGTLLGGALLHMVPEAIAEIGTAPSVFLWILAGFVTFFALEQFLHWQHCQRRNTHGRKPLTYLSLQGDGLHNFLGGMAVASAFITDVRVGISVWLAAAAHEIPQELGDFAVLVHGGWKGTQALLYNVASALTFVVGGLLALAVSMRFDVRFLLPFAAGNFIYIAASDLVPEVNRNPGLRENLVHLAALSAGIALLWALRALLG